MKTGSLRTVAVGCGLALVASAIAGCASRPSVPRDDSLHSNMEKNFGFSGRKIAVDLGQTGPVHLLPGDTRLEGGFLFLVESPNHLDALNRQTLLPEWAYHSLPGELRYPPTLSAISVLLMSGNELHQVDLQFGHGSPAIHFDMAPSSSFGGSAGTAYVPCWGGNGAKTLRTLNLATGLEGWGYRTPGDIRGGVLVGGDPPRQTVYFGTDAGQVYALPAAGASSHAPEVGWVRDTRGPVTAPLALAGDDLFAASESGFLYCMDRVTGIIRWAAAHETPLTEAPVATAKSVYQHHAGSLWCHDRATGAVRWKAAGATRFILERDGKALLASGDGELMLVNASGAVTGTMSTGGYYLPTNVMDDSLYAVSADGFVFKLERGGE